MIGLLQRVRWGKVSVSSQIIANIGPGLLVLVVDGLLTAVGESGAAPAVLAAWAAPAIFAAGGITALLYLEG